MSARTLWRKIVNVVMLTLTGVCAIFTVSVLFFILGYLVYNGGKSLSWEFFTHLPAPVGEAGGGMANAIVGSAKLLFLAALIGVPVGLLGGLYLAEFGERTVPFIVRYMADLLNGVPSIVIGIFAYAVIVLRTRHFSTWAGGVALGFMMIPDCPAQHRGIPARRAALHARRRHGPRRQPVEDDRQRGRSRGLARDYHRHPAGPGPRGRRDGALALHRFWQSLLESRLVAAHRFLAGHDIHLCRGTL